MMSVMDEPVLQKQSAADTGVRADTGAVSWSVGGLLRELAQREHHPAVVAFNDSGMETWDSETLADHARRLAHGLRQSGIGRGSAVALWAPNSPVWIICALAVLAAGGMLVPIDELAEPDAFADSAEIQQRQAGYYHMATPRGERCSLARARHRRNPDR